jgi:hypothetical protein
MSRVVGEEAELTGATDAIGARRWPWDRRRTTVELHGCAHGVRQRCEGGLLGRN